MTAVEPEQDRLTHHDQPLHDDRTDVARIDAARSKEQPAASRVASEGELPMPPAAPELPHHDESSAPQASVHAAYAEPIGHLPRSEGDHQGHDHASLYKQVEHLLGGPEEYTLPQAAQAAGISVQAARHFWLSMGFPTIEDEQTSIVFTRDDVEMMTRHREMIEGNVISEATMNSLVRAISHAIDRLVAWQNEALVEQVVNREHLNPVRARGWLIQHAGDYEDFLQQQMRYAWRRLSAASLRRLDSEAAQLQEARSSQIEVFRAVSFVDMVAFTARSSELSPQKLVKLIETFEYTCRDVIASHGAHVVKTIGDAFLFTADDVLTGADVITSIAEELARYPEMPRIHGSLVWGSVVSRFGDVFGPTVNLASRLADSAASGSVLLDQKTAMIIHQVAESDYRVVPAGTPDLQGIGVTEAFELRRAR
ncbi:MAG: adenylate/guanylate cyclase domain-containing protein [Actinomycetaceae bacterium]|nr:adenylate/guanylate cyclase domain-containing protein [Actinomycetaceae bacterium]MDY6083612.1 adenylate/guanylate cyclase domain-containing protein [Actinomycetaceae bacterium]